MLLQKGVNPYQCMDEIPGEALPEKGITDADFTHPKRV